MCIKGPSEAVKKVQVKSPLPPYDKEGAVYTMANRVKVILISHQFPNFPISFQFPT